MNNNQNTFNCHNTPQDNNIELQMGTININATQWQVVSTNNHVIINLL